MKSSIKWLPSLMVFGFAATLAAQTPVAITFDPSVDRDAEIRQLRQELKIISDRLGHLEKDNKPNVPRGDLPPIAEVPGNSAVTPTASKSSAVTATVPTLTRDDAPTLYFFRGTTSNFGIDGY